MFGISDSGMNPHAQTQAMLWGADPAGWEEHSRRVLQPLYEEVMERLEPAPGERLLDAGCGAGLLAVMAARRGADVTGVDVSEDLVRDAAARGGGPRYVVGDLESLPLPDAQFDAVAALNSVPYARDAGAALAELARVTAPGGRLLLTVGVGSAQAGTIDDLAAAGEVPDWRLDLRDPAVLGAALQRAGYQAPAVQEIAFDVRYADVDDAVASQLPAGPVQAAIRNAGADRVERALRDQFAAQAGADGSVVVRTSFRCALATRA
jgi:SAM-dependent methyltransferase